MAEPAPNPEVQPAPTIFEQPLNERMRTFMRLDFLYNQALYQSEIATAASALGVTPAQLVPAAPTS